MKHIESVCSLMFKLYFDSTCSMRIRSGNQDIAEKLQQLISNPPVTSGFFFFSGSTLILVAEIEPRSIFKSCADFTTDAKKDSDSISLFLIGSGDGGSSRFDSDSDVDFIIELLTDGTGLFTFSLTTGGGGVGGAGSGGETSSSACLRNFSSRTRSWTNLGRMKMSCGFFSLNDSVFSCSTLLRLQRR